MSSAEWVDPLTHGRVSFHSTMQAAEDRSLNPIRPYRLRLFQNRSVNLRPAGYDDHLFGIGQTLNNLTNLSCNYFH
jgi:hypothetical protein